ncbi:MAG: ComF family protein [Candidatus Amulumruptor caecigallinarius]|nr:ComF family protein [Candidatus Amulumruptor caecigallinarius]
MSVISDLGEFVFPRRCHICDGILQSGEKYVCTSCLARMPRTGYHHMANNPMEQRFAGLFPFSRATALFFYARGAEISELMQDLKYRRFRGLGRFLGELAADELLPTGFLTDVEAIVPVPIHRMKLAVRGYNQAMEIARGLSGRAALPVVRNLKARRPHHTQTRLSLEERHNNLKGVFQFCGAEHEPRRNFLILDDVCTTGSTLTAAAEALLSAIPDACISLLAIGVTF